MTTRIRAIAFNTFREAVRDRVLYNLVFFALLLISAGSPQCRTGLKDCWRELHLMWFPIWHR